MRKLITIFIFFSVFNLSAQDIKAYGISLDSVKVWTQKHPKYFEYLKSKLLKKDVKISQEEMFMLYYGSAFVKGYSPKKESRAVEQVTQLINEFLYPEAIAQGKELLKQYPVNSRLYMLLGYAYKKENQKELSKFYYKRFADILKIPLHSGDGKTYEKAYIVRNFSDEYLILNQNDWELSQQRLGYHQKFPFDEMKVMRKGNKHKLYFNIYLPFFIGENRTFSQELQHGIEVYKIDTAQYKRKKFFKNK